MIDKSIDKSKEAIRSERVILPGPMRQVRIDKLGRDDLRQNEKLPPDHGSTPRFTTVPPEESLPRKK